MRYIYIFVFVIWKHLCPSPTAECKIKKGIPPLYREISKNRVIFIEHEEDCVWSCWCANTTVGRGNPFFISSRSWIGSVRLRQGSSTKPHPRRNSTNTTANITRSLSSPTTRGTNPIRGRRRRGKFSLTGVVQKSILTVGTKNVIFVVTVRNGGKER